jgi:membrane-associated phospholipid phosphatase
VSGSRAVDPHGLGRATRAVLLYGVLFANLLALAFVRSKAPPLLLAGGVAVSLALLYAVGRRQTTFRPWAVYSLAFLLFAYLRGLADETGIPARFDYVVDLERALFADTTPTLWLQERLYAVGEIGPAEIASVAVYASYFVVPHLVALVLWWRRPDLFGRYASALLGTAYLGLAVSFAAPTAPPWLAGQSGHLPFVSRIVEDVANGVDPAIYERGYEIVGANPVSAMPSLHMAMTVIVVLAAWRGRLPVRVAGLLYALAMGFALVYAGEHFMVDLVAGAAVAALAWRVAGAGDRVRLRLPLGPLARRV